MMGEGLKEAAAALRKDARARDRAVLYVSLAAGCGYACLNAVGGVLLRSPWLGTLAFYYIMLSLLRFNLTRGYKQGDRADKWKRYRLTAVLMLFLTVALFGIFCMTVYSSHIIAYPGYLIYGVAAYAFYAVVSAVRNIIVCRRYDDPVLSASKALKLAAAVISVYSLQSALISAFGDDEAFRAAMGKWVGGGAFLVIAGVSVYMIIKSSLALRRV